jgi:hypothetical protein
MPTPKKGYFLDDGTQCPGCTTILGCVSTSPADALIGWGVSLFKQGKDFREERDRLGQVGTYIHDTLEHVERPAERPIWANDEEWSRIRKAHAEWSIWLEEYKPEVLSQEQQLVSKEFRCGGTYDNVLRWKGKVYVGDFKSGKSIDKAKVAAQLAFYAHVVTETSGLKVDGALIFHLPAKGSMKVIELGPEEMEKGIALFRAARAAYDAIGAFRRAA